MSRFKTFLVRNIPDEYGAKLSSEEILVNSQREDVPSRTNDCIFGPDREVAKVLNFSDYKKTKSLPAKIDKDELDTLNDEWITTEKAWSIFEAAKADGFDPSGVDSMEDLDEYLYNAVSSLAKEFHRQQMYDPGRIDEPYLYLNHEFWLRQSSLYDVEERACEDPSSIEEILS